MTDTPKKRGRPRNYTHLAPVSVSLPPPVKKKLQDLARKDGLSLAAWIRRLALRSLAA